jgi:hypothetical protein
MMPALLFVDPTPDTVGYLVAGYVFLIGLPVLYILSWYVRQRSLQRDLETIESLAADERQRGAKPGAATGPAELTAKADKPSAP